MKKYRERSGEKYETISLTIEQETMDGIEKMAMQTEDKNISSYIEKNVINSPIEEMPKRRKFKTYPVKKTFTFTKGFVDHIRKSGNMSMFVEHVLESKI